MKYYSAASLFLWLSHLYIYGHLCNLLRSYLNLDQWYQSGLITLKIVTMTICSSMTPSTVILSSYASLVPLLIMSNSKNEEKVLVKSNISGYAGSLRLTCGYASQFHKSCVHVRSVIKDRVRTPVRRKFYSKKVTCGYF